MGRFVLTLFKMTLTKNKKNNPVSVLEEKDNVFEFKINSDAEYYQWESVFGQYKNPMSSFLREIICNAIDTQTISKSKENVQVIIDTINFTVTIKDKGTGLNETDIKEIYSEAYNSTKRSELKSFGEFGIGKLSPLSYTDTIMIHTVKENIAIDFTINKSYPPIIIINNKSKTVEKSGTSITINIKETDCNEIISNAKNICFFLKNVDLIIDNEISNYKYDYFLVEKTSFLFSNWNNSTSKYNYFWNYKNKIKASYNNIIYDIDFSYLDLPDLIGDFYLKFKIGELQVNQTREEIINNEHNKTIILKRYEEFKKEINEYYTNTYLDYIKNISNYIPFISGNKSEYYVACLLNHINIDDKGNTYTYTFTTTKLKTIDYIEKALYKIPEQTVRLLLASKENQLPYEIKNITKSGIITTKKNSYLGTCYYLDYTKLEKKPTSYEIKSAYKVLRPNEYSTQTIVIINYEITIKNLEERYKELSKDDILLLYDFFRNSLSNLTSKIAKDNNITTVLQKINKKSSIIDCIRINKENVYWSKTTLLKNIDMNLIKNSICIYIPYKLFTKNLKEYCNKLSLLKINDSVKERILTNINNILTAYYKDIGKEIEVIVIKEKEETFIKEEYKNVININDLTKRNKIGNFIHCLYLIDKLNILHLLKLDKKYEKTFTDLNEYISIYNTQYVISNINVKNFFTFLDFTPDKTITDNILFNIAFLKNNIYIASLINEKNKKDTIIKLMDKVINRPPLENVIHEYKKYKKTWLR